MRIHERAMYAWEAAKLGPEPEDGPENNAAIAMCVSAWDELDSCRDHGFTGTGMIPFVALVRWAEVERLDWDSFTLLRRVLRQLDIDREDRKDRKRAGNRAGKGKKK